MPLPPEIGWWKNLLGISLDKLLHILGAALILVAAYLIVLLMRKLIRRLFSFTRVDYQKQQTLQTVLNSAARYSIYTVAILMVLTLFGVEIGPLLAGLGIAGVALGFGAQSLVKDLITGFFILFEGHIHVGDSVEINALVRGTVEEVGLRMTAVREWSGAKFYLPNSEIKTIRNYSREQQRAIVTSGFPLNENPGRIREILTEACRQVQENHREHLLATPDGSLVEEPQVYGVTALDLFDRKGQFTIIARTQPNSTPRVEAALREAIWEKSLEYGTSVAEGS